MCCTLYRAIRCKVFTALHTESKYYSDSDFQLFPKPSDSDRLRLRNPGENNEAHRFQCFLKYKPDYS